MAGAVATQGKPKPAQTVQVELPPGMSQEEFQNLFGTFKKAVVQGRARGRADSKAIRRLMNAHKDELLGYRREEWRKENLDSSNLKVLTPKV